MAEVYTRRIKSVVGVGTGTLTVYPSPNKRLHNVQLCVTTSGGTNTLAAFCAGLTEIRVKYGTRTLWRLNGTKLRDFVLLRGTTYDFNGLPNTSAIITLPFAPEWFLDNVADALALNPSLLGGAISVEVDTNLTTTACVAFERVSDDLDAPSAGVMTLETIRPVAGGTSFFVKEEIEARGRLISASIYPDTGGSNEITPASLLIPPDDAYAHEALTSAQNDELLERYGLTPSASGRTANVYDIVFVKGDALSRSIPLLPGTRIKVEAGSAMSGTCDILLCRLEPNPLGPSSKK